MKKYFKKAIAIALASAMSLSSLIVTSAQDLSSASKLAKLQELGIITGENGHVNPDKNMTRYRAIGMMFRLSLDDSEGNNLEDYMMDYDYEGKQSFEDAEGKSTWVQRLMSYCKNNNVGINGYPDGTLKPLREISAKEYAAVMLQTLGYKIDSDFTWETIASKAVEVGIVDNASQINNDKINVLNIGEMTYNALATPYKNSYETLGEKVDKAVVESKLAVKEVEGLNLKQLQVTFNKEIDSETVTSDNFEIGRGSHDTHPVLQDDNRTVIMEVNDRDIPKLQPAEYEVTIKNVKDIDGNVLEEQYNEDVTVFDGKLPRIQEIKWTGPKSFQATFSEPIKTEGKVTVENNNSRLSVKSGEVSDSDRSVVNVELYSSLKDDTDYTISINGYSDYAGYQNLSYKESVTYQDSEELPVASIGEVTQKVVEVNFSNPVKNLTKEHFYHTFTGWTAVGLYSDKDLTNEVNSKDYHSTVYAQFATDGKSENPLPSGDVEFTIKSRANDKELQDAWGNKYPGETFNIQVGADRTNPEIVEVKSEAKNEITVKFSKPMNQEKLEDRDNYTLYEDGDKVRNAITDATASSDKKSVTLTTKDYTGKTMTLEIKGLVDDTLYENRLDSYTEEIEFGDKEFKGVSRVEYDQEEECLFVIYKEPMNDTAIDKDNYQLENDGNITNFSSDPYFYDGDKVVRIDLNEDEEKLVKEDGTQLVVGRVEDTSGNSPAGFLGGKFDIQQVGTVKPQATKVTATDSNKLAVQFDQELVDVDEDDFEVAYALNGSSEKTTANVAGIELDENDDGTVVILELENNFRADAENIIVKSAESITGTSNVFGVAMDEFLIDEINDEIAPELVEDEKENKAIYALDENTVLAVFNEEIDIDSLSIFDIEIADRKVESVSLTDAGLEKGDIALLITLKENEDYTSAEDLYDSTITIERVADNDRNITENISERIAEYEKPSNSDFDPFQ